MFVKHIYPPKLKYHCDHNLYSRNLKFNRDHLLVMTNYHTKLEDPWAMSSQVIDWTRFVCGPTDMCKAIHHLFFEGGHSNV